MIQKYEYDESLELEDIDINELDEGINMIDN